ncbi:MAG: UDP-N-acetylmuramate--L-alanine ligase [Peptostreptococcaceae bacterium]|nr:UDP-N-acetylmuramate--L-alanine ligase [Peptostreptococcaceae bacterium]
MKNAINQSDFNPYDKIHMIGIGGIGMSAIAELLLSNGKTISGSDINSSTIIDKLIKKGANIFIGHSADHIKNTDLIIYTSAVAPDNLELSKAIELKMHIMDRAEALGLIMKAYKERIAVSGAHGKTTTTSMLSMIMEDSGVDPTILVGGVIEEISGNVKVGKMDYMITEACEYKENFLKFHPTLEIILNVDEDHLDYYQDLKHIMQAFERFTECLPKNGTIVANYDDYNVKVICATSDKKTISYGINTEADYQALNIVYNDSGFPSFDIMKSGKFYGHFNLSVPGTHNIYNALAAITVSDIYGVKIETMQNRLKSFCNPKRRFEIKHKQNGITIIDDYAHHPNEIKATLEATERYPHKRIWSIFQPHTFTRTKALLSDFSSAFGKADRVVITDIYAAREKDLGEIHSSDLARLVNGEGVSAKYISSFEDVAAYVADHAAPGDVILTMGAGDVYKIGDLIAIQLESKINL